MLVVAQLAAATVMYWLAINMFSAATRALNVSRAWVFIALILLTLGITQILRLLVTRWPRP
jgi:hypothetical protein